MPSPAETPAEIPAALEIDYFSQARKALSERCPFDVAEETSTSAAVTLPSGLASLLNRHGDNRKRHKKSHSGGGDKKKKKSSRASEKLRSFNVWVETEEFNAVSSEDEKKQAPIFNVVSSENENEKNAVEEVNNENGSLGIELSDVVELEKALPLDDDKNCDASDDPDEKGDVDDSVPPCVLCSKKGGALKPVNSAVEDAGSAQHQGNQKKIGV
ncbi:hypothetical protein TSUD_149350 [Trifolium subterraneum]|uniref:Uncharacterized protein n=1 Tax=Trifolium subterraneum TaxID=3900 RepID=A0A2Z6NHS4_TRISU|nr:hypothetical protein TSUD_149350 [Trifolium subterraneum]